MADFISTGYFRGPAPGHVPYSWGSPSSWFVSGLAATGAPGAGDSVFIDLPSSGLGYSVAITAPETVASLSFDFNSIASPVASQALTLQIEGPSAFLDVTGYVFGTGQLLPGGVSQAVVLLGNSGSLEVDQANPLGDNSLTVSFQDGLGSVLTLGAFNGTAGAALGFEERITALAGSDEVLLSNISYLSGSWSYSYDNSTDLLRIFSGAAQTGTEVADLTITPGGGSNALSPFTLFSSGGKLAIEENPVCYCAGTLLLTPRGEMRVEDLRAGDEVLTLEDGVQTALPVVWIGHRRIDVARHRHPSGVLPVRIRAGACGAGLPRRDLLVSPDHAIFVDGVLVPARLLINGRSIVQESGIGQVSYYHVELPRHAVLLAEGLPAESYLNTGNRNFFAGSASMALHPEFAVDASLKCWKDDACAPLAVDPAVVEPIWRRFADMAGIVEYSGDDNQMGASPELVLRVNGCDIRPVSVDDEHYVFAVPGEAAAEIVSAAFAPSDLRPWNDDRRSLGVCVSRITLRSRDTVTELPVDHPGLTDGWWAAECTDATMWRWTDGGAILPLPHGTEIVDIEVKRRAKVQPEAHLRAA